MAACSVSPSVPDVPEFGHHECAPSWDMPGARPARRLVKPELTASAKHPSLGVPVKSCLHAGDTYGRSAHTRHNTLCMVSWQAVMWCRVKKQYGIWGAQ